LKFGQNQSQIRRPIDHSFVVAHFTISRIRQRFSETIFKAKLIHILDIFAPVLSRSPKADRASPLKKSYHQMTLLRLGRDILDNNVDSLRSLPFIQTLSKLPIPFLFPGRRLSVQFPTPLILAIYLGRPEVVAFLLSKEVEANAVHRITGWSPFHYASQVNDIRSMTLLCEHGADVEPVGPSGETPLHVAILNGHYHATAFLIERGADPNRRVGDDTPLQPR
jgi:hypothetical protein